MNEKKYTPMMEQYMEIKKQYQDCILFFRLGDFYEMFMDDALEASRDLEITLTSKNAGGDEKVPMCGVPHHSAENYISQLVEKGHKVAICEQMEEPSLAKGLVRREVVRIVTRGTVMEEMMLEGEKNNYILAVYPHEKGISFATCDVSTGEFYGMDVGADKSVAINQILHFSPSEIIYYETEEIKKMLDEVSLYSPFIHNHLSRQQGTREFREYYIKQFGQDATEGIIGASGMLLSYLQQAHKKTLEQIHYIQICRPHDALILDYFTRRNLELSETVRGGEKQGSLLWLLDQTQTAMGARLLRRWMGKPLVQKAGIEERLHKVEWMVQHASVQNKVENLLKNVYDLERLAGRVAYGNANGRDLINLKQSLQQIPLLKDILKYAVSFHSLTEEMDECHDVIQIIQQAILDEPPISIKEGGLIRDGYHTQLDEYRETLREGKKWIEDLERKEKEETGVKLKIGYNKVFGYYIEVSKANLSSLPEGRYTRLQTLANAERFITDELRTIAHKMNAAEGNMLDLEYKIFCEVRSLIAKEVVRIQELAGNIACMDVLQSFARVSREKGYVKPTMEEGNSLFIEEGKHPVIETSFSNEPFISNSCFLNPKEKGMLLITGPNMAGKSTYMRQNALIVIMAQMGCFVPAKQAKIGIVDRIFTRIGAADDLVAGQSTFMIEMKDIEIMLRQATPSSLLLIDEIGRGTSTQDGISIAHAVIEYIHHNIGCKALISTHYHELASIEQELTHLKNVHMAVKEEGSNVEFLRKVKEGSTNRSFGIYCAKIAGLPDEVIARSESLLTFYADYKYPLEIISSNNSQSGSLLYQKIKEVDILHMTPIEAMQVLFELKKMV